MKALVTGAAGFIGSHLSAALVESGATVTGIDCFTDYYSRPLKEANLATLKDHPGFTFIEGALQDLDLAAVLAGTTHVFHLAGQAGVRKSWGGDFDVYIRDNIQATQRLLESMARMPIQKYVYSSSSSVYGNHVPLPMREDAYLQPLSPYGVTKLAGEHLGHLYSVNHGVPTVSLRYFTVYGPRQRPDMAFQRFLTAARDGKPITVYGDGEQTRDFTFVSDIVAANMAAAALGPSGQRVQYWWWLAGHIEPCARAGTEGDRKDGCHSARSRAERRHAPHLRRYVGCPPRSRLQPAGDSRGRPRPAISVAY